MSILTINEGVTDRAANKLLTSADEIEREVSRRVTRLIRNADTTGGNFDVTAATNELINEIRAEIQDIVYSSNLGTAVDDYLDDFDEIEENIIKIQKNFNGIDVSPSTISSAKMGAIDQTTRLLAGAGVEVNFINPINDLLFQRVNLGTNVVETERLLRGMITGVEGRNGLLTRWVGQAARDAINQYEGNAQSLIKTKFDLNAWAYVGNIVTDSRAQCRRWVNKEIIKDSELNRQLEWARKNGSGLIPGTTADNFGVYRGGYNCRHKAIPTRVTKTGRKGKGAGKNAEPEAVKTNEPTTLAGASKFARDNKLAKEVDYEKIGIKDVETANRINRQIQQLQDKYGLLELNSIKKERRRTANASANGQGLNINSTYFNGGYRKGYVNNVVNFRKVGLERLEEVEKLKEDRPELFKGSSANARNNRKVLKSLQERVNFERWVADQKDFEIESTITHEFGHVIHDQKLGGINRSLRKFGTAEEANELNAEIFTVYRKAVKNGDIHKISQYGASNDKEFFAESFVMYEYERADLPDYIIELIEKVLKFGT